MSKLKYPFIARHSSGGTLYAIVQGSSAEDVTLILLKGQYDEPGKVYSDAYSEETFVGYLRKGTYVVETGGLVKQPKADVAALTLQVDTSALTNALAAANALEATLLRIKGMLRG